MFDMIEHIPQPHKIMVEIRRVLKDEGIVVISTPDIESLFAKILKNKCPFLVRMHVIFYSPKTLTLLLEEHGFTILDLSYYGRTFSISYFLDRIQAKNILLKKGINIAKKLSPLVNMPITLNLHDSFRIVAQKR